MQQQAQRAITAIAYREERADIPHRIIGLLLVSLVPAVFWTGLVATVGTALGHTMNPTALATFGLAIAAFCAALGQVFLSRN
jgi:hypothetical protein